MPDGEEEEKLRTLQKKCSQNTLTVPIFFFPINSSTTSNRRVVVDERSQHNSDYWFTCSSITTVFPLHHVLMPRFDTTDFDMSLLAAHSLYMLMSHPNIILYHPCSLPPIFLCYAIYVIPQHPSINLILLHAMNYHVHMYGIYNHKFIIITMTTSILAS